MLSMLLLATVLAAAAPDTNIALPKPDTQGSVTLDRVLQTRRSVRDFDSKPIPLAAVSQLLWAAQGVTSTGGRRTAPSAGALYPLEILLVATRVDGLDPGVYRYVPPTHSLRRTAAGKFDEAIAAAARGQQSVADAAAVIVIAGVDQRTTKKYGPRAARYVPFEAGCAAQNVLLEVLARGLGCVVVGAFDDTSVSGVVRLEAGETPIVLLPVGFPKR